MVVVHFDISLALEEQCMLTYMLIDLRTLRLALMDISYFLMETICHSMDCSNFRQS